ncbi:MAG: TldD/PmbA family protein [Myxococcales bacterium]|nr:TldD/PmbA family protein [Myxococcales bacterium]
MRDPVEELKDLARRAAARAVRSGAEAAEAMISDSVELSVKVRLGEPELVHEAGSRVLGLRVFRDRRAAVTYTSDFGGALPPRGSRSSESTGDAALDRFIDESVTLAELAEPDELNELPAEGSFAPSPLPELELYDEAGLSVTAAQAIAFAREGEAAARGYSDKITNSEGATYSRTSGATAFAIEGRGRGGFSGGYRSSYQSLTVEPIADEQEEGPHGRKKRNGHYWTAARFASALESPESVGREAARRTIAKLGAEKIETGALPVVFDPEAGRGLLRALFSVLSGGAIYRRSSYLLDREGTAIASPLVTIVDDPLIPRAPGSRPYDGDGLPSRTNVIVENGILRTFLLDTYSARKLGRTSNGCAGRGVGGAPHVTTSNFILQPGTATPAQALSGIERGLYVTDLMGFGFNAVTGDFSRGAAGFLIEHGQLSRPVSEVTVSSNFDALWRSIDLVADDIDRRSSTACPTFRVAQMMIAGR